MISENCPVLPKINIIRTSLYMQIKASLKNIQT